MFVFLSFYVALAGVENERENIGAFPALAVTGKTWSRAKNVQGCRGRGGTGRGWALQGVAGRERTPERAGQGWTRGRNGDTRAGQAHPRGTPRGRG